jgi:hypothetical protein
MQHRCSGGICTFSGDKVSWTMLCGWAGGLATEATLGVGGAAMIEYMFLGKDRNCKYWISNHIAI